MALQNDRNSLFISCGGVPQVGVSCARVREFTHDLATPPGSTTIQVLSVVGSVYTIQMSFPSIAQASIAFIQFAWLASNPTNYATWELRDGAGLHLYQLLQGGAISAPVSAGLSFTFTFDTSTVWAPAAPCNTLAGNPDIVDFATSQTDWVTFVGTLGALPANTGASFTALTSWSLLPAPVGSLIYEVVPCTAVPPVPAPGDCVNFTDVRNLALTPSGWRKVDGFMSAEAFQVSGAHFHSFVGLTGAPEAYPVPDGLLCDDGHEAVITASDPTQPVTLTGTFLNAPLPVVLLGANAFGGGKTVRMRWFGGFGGWLIEFNA